MYYNILLATDLTEGGKSVARKAWELSNQFDAKLYIVHVVEPIPAYGYPGVTDITSPHIDEAKKLLIRWGEEYMVPKDRQFVLVGQPKHEILNKVKELKVDLIVIGSHGRHGLARILGSTASAVLNSAECDVITIRYKP